MQTLYLQLNSLVVLTGISIAIIQYLFTNHQANITSLLKKVSDINLSFIEKNKQDQALKDNWDNLINKCKQHSYSTNPNDIIIKLFTLIIVISILYIFLYAFTLAQEFYSDQFFIIHIILIIILFIMLFIILIRLIYLLYLSRKVILEIIDKAKYFKEKFNDIQKEHDFIVRITSNT